jgi:hypothetical protein
MTLLRWKVLLVKTDKEMELWPVQDQPSIEAQRLIAKRAYLRGLIRNNSTLITSWQET